MVARRTPSIGSLFANRYRIEGVLGQGAMGVVLAVRDQKMGIDCALKILTRADVRVDAARVVREGRALMLISSPHVVRVFDVGQDPAFGPYLVLERLEGKNLAELAPMGLPWPWKRVAGYASQVCVALSEAHAAQVVHRDVKLSNVFVARQRDGSDIVKVLDFGIAKVAAPDEQSKSTLTKEKMLGSPQFMSPEQIADPRAVDARTDLWSLGVVMFRLLTGRFPFTGSSAVEISTAVLKHQVGTLASHGVEAPPMMQSVLDRCFEKRLEHRWSSATELGAALRSMTSPGVVR